MHTATESGIDKAVRLAGSQTALANLLEITPQAVQKWASQGYVPSDRCREVETKLNHQVTRYELNPKVFGDVPEELSSTEQSAAQLQEEEAQVLPSITGDRTPISPTT